MAANVHIRHPNRSVDKGEVLTRNRNQQKNRINKSTSETSIGEKTSTNREELSERLTKETFSDLSNYKTDPCISIFLLTHRSGVEVNERMDNIAFKNALQKIAAILKEKEMDPLVAQRITAPAYDLLQDDQFWYNQSDYRQV